MTRVVQGGPHEHTIWKLDNPAAGTNSVIINTSDANSPQPFSGTAVSFTGTNAASSTGASATNSGSSGNPSLTMTTINNNSIIYDNLYYDVRQTITPNSPQSKLSEIQDAGSGNYTSGASALNTTASGSQSLGWSHAGTDSDWAEIAIEINPTP